MIGPKYTAFVKNSNEIKEYAIEFSGNDNKYYLYSRVWQIGMHEEEYFQNNYSNNVLVFASVCLGSIYYEFQISTANIANVEMLPANMLHDTLIALVHKHRQLYGMQFDSVESIYSFIRSCRLNENGVGYQQL